MEYLVIKPFSVNHADPFPVGARIDDSDFEPHLIQTWLELGNIKETNDDGEVDDDATPTLSTDLRASDAMKQLSQLNTVEEVNDFVRGDQRTTVQNAANSRRNALLGGAQPIDA